MVEAKRKWDMANSDDYTLGGDAHLPLYRRLRESIAGKIASGEYKPGLALPAEIEIARLYKIAPGTARKAIEELVKEGLLERRHGAGTFVRRPNFNNSMLRFFLFRGATGKTLTPESRIVSRSVEDPSDAVRGHLGIAPGDKVIHLRRLRLWDGAARLVEDIYLPFTSSHS